MLLRPWLGLRGGGGVGRGGGVKMFVEGEHVSCYGLRV